MKHTMRWNAFLLFSERKTISMFTGGNLIKYYDIQKSYEIRFQSQFFICLLVYIIKLFLVLQVFFSVVAGGDDDGGVGVHYYLLHFL